MIIRLNLKFHCGCGFKMTQLAEALYHSKTTGHVVVISGTLFRVLSPVVILQELDTEVILDNHSVIQAWYVCGDGFSTRSFAKAREHIRKTGHKITISGVIKPGLISGAKGGTCNLLPAGRSHSLESGGRGQ